MAWAYTATYCFILDWTVVSGKSNQTNIPACSTGYQELGKFYLEVNKILLPCIYPQPWGSLQGVIIQAFLTWAEQTKAAQAPRVGKAGTYPQCDETGQGLNGAGTKGGWDTKHRAVPAGTGSQPKIWLHPLHLVKVIPLLLIKLISIDCFLTKLLLWSLAQYRGNKIAKQLLWDKIKHWSLMEMWRFFFSWCLIRGCVSSTGSYIHSTLRVNKIVIVSI